MTLYLGIDPGLGGYVAVLDQDQGQVELSPTPTADSSRDGRRRYDLQGMLRILLSLPAEKRKLCVLERAQAMPKNGGVANFSAGYGYGLWRMALTASVVPTLEIAPAIWKRKLGILGRGESAAARRRDSKRRAVEKAMALFPGVSLLRTPRSKKPCPDMAEALLLAWIAAHGGMGLG